MSSAYDRKPKPTSMDFAVFGTGYLLYQIARDLVGSQGVADLIDRVALVFLGMAVPVAWFERRRWWAAFYATFTVFRVLQGPPTIGTHSTVHMIAVWFLVVLLSTGIVFAIVNRWRATHGSNRAQGTLA